MLRNEMKKYIKICLEELCVNIGSRPAGSTGHSRAEELIVKCLEHSGLIVDVQKYDCPYWKLESYSLSTGKNSLKAIPNTFSPSCDISAPIIAMNSIEDLAQKDLNGKIAVLYGLLTEQKFFPKNFDFYRDEQQDRIISLLEEKKPSAIITVVNKNESCTPVIEDSDFYIPSMTISQETGEYLLKNNGNDVELKISSQRIESFSSNIIARNAIKSSRRIVICAHYDTKYGTPGALDNASGVAALLALAEILKEKDLNIGMEFILFGGEDSWYPGDVEYVKRNEEYLNAVSMAINIDGIGFKDSKSTVAFLECPQDLTEKVLGIKEKFHDIIQIEPWYDGDQSLFWPRGIPSIAMTSNNAGHLLDNIIHTEADTLDLLDLDKIIDLVMFICELVNDNM